MKPAIKMLTKLIDFRGGVEFHLVGFGFAEGQQRTTTARAALVVMVINEDQCVTIGHHSPSFTVISQVLQLVVAVEGVTEVHTVFEFGDATHSEILVGFNRLRI